MDKNKIIEAATKFVQQGKYDKAIKEYEKILQADPKDARIQQKLGEIYQKKGDNGQAADYFLKVAESYSGDGFALRAVAVYKQVLKLDDKRIAVNIKLAELYKQLGLMSDAMAQLQLVSAHYEKTGNSASSLDVLKQMVELDSDNVASRIKLAELYARDNLNAEAVSEFQKAATYLKRNNRIDDYVKVAERLVFLDPNDVALSRELAQIYLTKQDTKRALAKLQICFKSDPRDIDTLTLLAQAFFDLGQTSKTVSVYKELAKIYEEQGRVDDERAIWDRIAQIAPDDPDAAQRLQPAAVEHYDAQPEPEVEPEPPPQPVARRGTSTFKRLEEPAPTLTADQIAKLLTETDVYVKYGLHDKAVDHLKKIFAVDPENLDAHDKQYQIAVNAGEKAAATEDRLIKVIRLAAAQGDIARAQARLQTLLENNPGHELVPEFLQTIGTAAPEEAHEIVDDSILIDSVDEVVEDDAVAADAEMVVDGGDEVLAAADEAAGHEVFADEPLGDAAAIVPSERGPGDEVLAEAVEDEPLVPDSEAFPADEPLAFADDAVADEAVLADEPLVADEAQIEPLAGSDEFATVHGDAVMDELLLADPDASAALVADEVYEAPADPLEPFAQIDGEPAFTDARSEAQLEATDEPPTGEQSQAAAASAAETDFSSLDEPSEPDEPEREPEGVTRVVNLADLARMREEIAAKAAAPKPAPHPEPEPGPRPTPEEQVTLARVPVARPASRSLSAARPPSQGAARPPSKGTAVAGKGVHTSPTMMAAPRPDLVRVAAEEPPPDVDPASEELEEASFFIEQGVFDEAREILETVQLAYPGNKRALELLEQLEAKEKGGTPAPEKEDSGSDASFDLAQELADELGDVPTGPESAALGTADDGFQIAAEDVFAEFKKGVSKVVKPEDVDTHYDLGIAYKEMGLFNDAIGEFEQAMKGATGKPREIDCHLMVGACKQLAGDAQGAIVSFIMGVDLPQMAPDQAKAFHYEIAAGYEGMGRMGKALTHYLKVTEIDPRFRDAAQKVEQLQADGAEPEPEDDPPASRGSSSGGSSAAPTHINGTKKGGGDGNDGTSSAASGDAPVGSKAASRKIGYV